MGYFDFSTFWPKPAKLCDCGFVWTHFSSWIFYVWKILDADFPEATLYYLTDSAIEVLKFKWPMPHSRVSRVFRKVELCLELILVDIEWFMNFTKFIHPVQGGAVKITLSLLVSVSTRRLLVNKFVSP